MSSMSLAFIGQDNLAPELDNLAPGQVGTKIVKADNLAPRKQTDNLAPRKEKIDNLAPDNQAPGQFGIKN